MKATDAPMITMSKNNVFCIVFEAVIGVNVENVLSEPMIWLLYKGLID